MTFKRFCVVTLLTLGLAQFSAFAQNKTITGKVLDSGNLPVVGAAVIQEGTRNGNTTGVNGEFSINVPAKEVTLEVSCLGYVTQRVTVPATQGTVTVILSEDTMSISETVVVGYGTQKKVNLTGAISVVESSSLENRTATTLGHMLQGSVPGLNITTSSGYPGSSPSINIRGTNSINGGSPLVLIDGVEGDMARVNPNDVESISVIKDASSAAIYGARASFGVILITTKNGASTDGKATVRYSGRLGWQANTTSRDYETTGYWSVYVNNFFWERYNPGTLYINYNDEDMAELKARINDKVEDPSRPWVVEKMRNGRNTYLYYANHDWYHTLYRDSHPVQQHNISMSGGTKNIHYFLSGNYDREQGVLNLHPDIMNKYTLRAKIDFKLTDWATFSNNFSFYGKNYVYSGNSGVNGSFNSFNNHALACFPLTHPDGTYVYKTRVTSYNIANGYHLALAGNATNQDRLTNFSNTSELTLNPFKAFTVKANFTYAYTQNRTWNRQTNATYSRDPGTTVTESTGMFLDRLNSGYTTTQYYATNVYGTYDNMFGQHHFTATAGFNFETSRVEAASLSGQNLMSEELNNYALLGTSADGTVVTTLGGSDNSYAIEGIFGRLNYDYAGKYLFEVSGRYDGTSRFARGHRWGFFPSASIGWRVSEEPFFEPLKPGFENLKIRASYGTLGNQQVGYYDYIRTISISNLSYLFGNQSAVSKQATISNPTAGNLTWETAEQKNLGIDAAWLSNRLTFTGEFYIRDTKDMLTAGYALPEAYGASSPKMNTADMRTKGYELTLGWRDGFQLAGKPFNYNVTAIFSDYYSTITKYNNPTKSFSESYYEGMRIGEIWGYHIDGFFMSDEEAAAYTVNQTSVNNLMPGGLKAGDLKYADLDGDGKIGIGANTVDDPGDRKIIGNSQPRFNYGLTVGFNWMNFDVSVFFQGVGKIQWYPPTNAVAFWGPFSRPYVTCLPKNFMEKCWNEETNTPSYFPRARGYVALGTNRELGAVNDKYLQNIAYTRFKNLTVGYTVPQKITKKAGIEGLRVYFSGENLAYWSPFKKICDYIDPEEARVNVNTVYQYPWQKTMMFGVDITF